MGYRTYFEGSISITPPLSHEEIAYLKTFAGTRRMNRREGPYFAKDDGDLGQSRTPGIINFNEPPEGQPGLWCQWVPTDDGTELEWDGGERFYDAPEWMMYLIDHFLRPDCLAALKVPGIVGGHILNGTIKAQGEEMNDRWLLIVKNNKVTTRGLE
jgi:hypothetical protein